MALQFGLAFAPPPEAKVADCKRQDGIGGSACGALGWEVRSLCCERMQPHSSSQANLPPWEQCRGASRWPPEHQLDKMLLMIEVTVCHGPYRSQGGQAAALILISAAFPSFPRKITDQQAVSFVSWIYSKTC